MKLVNIIFLTIFFNFEAVFSQTNSASTGSVSNFLLITDDRIPSSFSRPVVDAITNNKKSGVGCRIDITFLKEEEPVFLDYPSGRNLLTPQNGMFHLEAGQAVIIDCLDTFVDSTFFAFNDMKKNPLTAVCIGNYERKINQFLIGNRVDDQEFFGRCFEKNAQTTVQTSTDAQKCSGGELKQVGFSGSKGFIHYYDICFNPSTLTPIYAKHYINGQTINRKMPSSVKYTVKRKTTRPSPFYVDGLQRGQGAEVQRAYDTYNKLFDRGHLAPYADGIFWNWRRITNLYINIVPMRKSINTGNWGAIEDKVRALAGKLKRELTILSGGFETDAYLGVNDKVPSPKYLWKFVKDGNSGIVLIVRNDPKDTNAINLCTDICGSGNGWDTALPRRTDATKGKTICCPVADLKQKQRNFPIPDIESQNVNNVLKYQ